MTFICMYYVVIHLQPSLKAQHKCYFLYFIHILGVAIILHYGILKLAATGNNKKSPEAQEMSGTLLLAISNHVIALSRGFLASLFQQHNCMHFNLIALLCQIDFSVIANFLLLLVFIKIPIPKHSFVDISFLGI